MECGLHIHLRRGDILHDSGTVSSLFPYLEKNLPKREEASLRSGRVTIIINVRASITRKDTVKRCHKERCWYLGSRHKPTNEQRKKERSTAANEASQYSDLLLILP